MNLTDLLSSSVISSIAGQTGTSEKDTQNVLANALPALVGAMAQNASTEDGANSLATPSSLLSRTRKRNHSAMRIYVSDFYRPRVSRLSRSA